MTDIVDRLNGSLSVGYSELRKEAAATITRLRAKLEAAERDRATFITEIGNLCARLKAAEKERDDVAQQLVQAEIGKRKLDAECDALRAKVERMERQAPVGWLLEGNFYEVRQMSLYKDNEPLPGQTALYALPGAQPQLNEIKINLQRALELGQRETWTGARKHRSREDQREEQQCWNKVWGLLGAQGEEK